MVESPLLIASVLPAVAWGALSISIKTSSLFDLCKRGLGGGIQMASTQTFCHLEKTAAAIVKKTTNKNVAACGHLPPPPHEVIIITLNFCKWNNRLNQSMWRLPQYQYLRESCCVLLSLVINLCSLKLNLLTKRIPYSVNINDILKKLSI